MFLFCGVGAGPDGLKFGSCWPEEIALANSELIISCGDPFAVNNPGGRGAIGGFLEYCI